MQGNPESEFEKLKDIKDEPSGSLDNAKKEALVLEGDSQRNEQLKKESHKLLIVFIKLVFFLGVIVLIIRIYHLVTFSDYMWLSEDQINNIDRILFSGTIGGLVGKYFNTIFLKSNSEKKSSS